jgi:hypothetical protein
MKMGTSYRSRNRGSRQHPRCPSASAAQYSKTPNQAVCVRGRRSPSRSLTASPCDYRGSFSPDPTSQPRRRHCSISGWTGSDAAQTTRSPRIGNQIAGDRPHRSKQEDRLRPFLSFNVFRCCFHSRTLEVHLLTCLSNVAYTCIMYNKRKYKTHF